MSIILHNKGLDCYVTKVNSDPIYEEYEACPSTADGCGISICKI